MEIPFLIWTTDSSTGSLQVRPEVVAQLANIIYATFPNSIRPVTVEGYQIVNILGGVEICPASFNPQNLIKVDRLTHEFTPEQVTLLRTLIENLIIQSARSTESLAWSVYLSKNGLTVPSLLDLISTEVDQVVTPSTIDFLLSTTQPQSLALSYNTGIIKDILCQVNGQLPIIIFSASLLEKITRSISSNPKLSPILTNMGTFMKSYQDNPSIEKGVRQTSPSPSSPSSPYIMWIILIVAILVILGLILLVVAKY